MINYSMLGVPNLAEAADFYDEILKLLGAKVTHTDDRVRFYAREKGQPLFAICTPYNEEPAAPGNGSMVAMSSPTKELVSTLYNKAIALGATCEGQPGPRGPYGEFAYIRDPYGNKLAFCHLASQS